MPPHAGNHAFAAVAVDYDGTLTDTSRPGDDVLAAIADSRRHGLRVVLVTGRIMSELRAEFADVDRWFDAIVSENGAVIDAPSGHRLLAAPVPDELVAAVERRGVAVRRGEAIVALDGSDRPVAADELRRLGLDCQLLHNRAALMVLPAGVTKGTGVAAALASLGLSPRSAVAIGDAENDRALLHECEWGVAVGNAVASLRDDADEVVAGAAGDGVVELLRGDLLRGDGIRRSRRRRVRIGTFADGSPATLPTSQSNVLIIGESSSGKSYVAGLFAERLISDGYTVLVVDYEGDHVGLGALRHVVVVGGAHHLPGPDEICALLRQFVSVVVDLSLLDRRNQDSYVSSLGLEVRRLRQDVLLPHWLLADEAQRTPPELVDVLRSPARGGCFVTWRPDELPADVLDRFDVVVAVADHAGGAVPQSCAELIERWAHGVPPGGTQEPPPRGAAMLADAHAARPPSPFVTDARRSGHERHHHKYVDGDLPAQRRFYFRRSDSIATGQVAANLRDFDRIVGTGDDAVLGHHLRNRDFSRWILYTLKDPPLAVELAEIEGGFALEGDVSVARSRIVAALRRVLQNH